MATLALSVDYLFLNEKEAPLYARQPTLGAAIGHWRRHARNAVIKLGRRGCRWVSRSLDLRQRRRECASWTRPAPATLSTAASCTRCCAGPRRASACASATSWARSRPAPRAV
jgi:sugar/nucleoside kinase (ribokinase family)